MHLKEIVELYLPSEEVDDFALCAFGEDFRYFFHALHFMEAWNNRHDHQLRADGIPSEDIKEMVEIWKKR